MSSYALRGVIYCVAVVGIGVPLSMHAFVGLAFRILMTPSGLEVHAPGGSRFNSQPSYQC
jgi:hypothetical protein